MFPSGWILRRNIDSLVSAHSPATPRQLNRLSRGSDGSVLLRLAASERFLLPPSPRLRRGERVGKEEQKAHHILSICRAFNSGDVLLIRSLPLTRRLDRLPDGLPARRVL